MFVGQVPEDTDDSEILSRIHDQEMLQNDPNYVPAPPKVGPSPISGVAEEVEEDLGLKYGDFIVSRDPEQSIEQMIAYAQNSEQMVAPKQGSEEIRTFAQYSDGIVAHAQASEQMVANAQSIEQMIASAQNSEQMVAPAQHSEQIIAPKQSSEEIRTFAQYSDGIVAHAQSSEQMVAYAQNSEQMVAYAQNSEQMVAPVQQNVQPVTVQANVKPLSKLAQLKAQQNAPVVQNDVQQVAVEDVEQIIQNVKNGHVDVQATQSAINPADDFGVAVASDFAGDNYLLLNALVNNGLIAPAGQGYVQNDIQKVAVEENAVAKVDDTKF